MQQAKTRENDVVRHVAVEEAELDKGSEDHVHEADGEHQEVDEGFGTGGKKFAEEVVLDL